MSVFVNDPPNGGFIVVSPAVGIALNTSFLFTTYSWVDGDLPILYAFSSYGVSVEKKIVFRPAAAAPNTRVR